VQAECRVFDHETAGRVLMAASLAGLLPRDRLAAVFSRTIIEGPQFAEGPHAMHERRITPGTGVSLPRMPHRNPSGWPPGSDLPSRRRSATTLYKCHSEHNGEDFPSIRWTSLDELTTEDGYRKVPPAGMHAANPTRLHLPGSAIRVRLSAYLRSNPRVLGLP
jgi:hypothetical protein